MFYITRDRIDPEQGLNLKPKLYFWALAQTNLAGRFLNYKTEVIRFFNL